MKQRLALIAAAVILMTDVNPGQSATKCLTLQEARKEYKDKHLRYRLDDGDKCWGINLPRRSRDVEYEPKRKIEKKVAAIIRQNRKVQDREPVSIPPTDLFPPNFAPPMPPPKPQEPVYATIEPEGIIYSTFGTGVEMPLIWPPNVLSDADTARMGLGFIVIGVSVLAFGLATLFVKGD